VATACNLDQGTYYKQKKQQPSSFCVCLCLCHRPNALKNVAAPDDRNQSGSLDVTTTDLAYLLIPFRLQPL